MVIGENPLAKIDLTHLMQKSLPPFYIPLECRRFLRSLAFVSAGFTVPGYLAEVLTFTPQATQGSYYPRGVNIPLDDDNDLALYNPNSIGLVEVYDLP
jgi:hypothetical protein